jgi:hypothetical protein
MAPPAIASPSHEEIASLAYRIWESEGRPEGHALEHWIEATNRLQGERSAICRP